MTSSNMIKIDRLRQAIQVLDKQRDVLGDSVVEASIEAIKKQLAELEGSEEEVARQRKLATVLFSDIVGHTKLIQDLDPEENMEIIDGALVLLAEIVESHGGHVTRFQGDGFKAIFGVPTARESDPERAIHAGLGIITAAQEYAVQLEAKWNLTGFNVRVGIDTGLIVAGGATEAADTIKGLVVNMAARLESAAPPGGLLISHHTYQHVQGVFDVEAQEPILAKGFLKPVQVYRVNRAKPRALRQDIRGVKGIETKMIGRDGELAQLQKAYKTAVSQKQTTVVTLVGEAGVGKSRLLFEFVKWLERQPEQIQTFNGRASQQTQNIPHYLVRDMLATRFQILDSDPLDIVRQKFVAGLAEFLPDEAEMKAHILGTYLGYNFGDSTHLKSFVNNPQQIKNRSALYLAQFFTAIAAESATVLLLESLHWADGGSLDTLIDLARRRSQIPLLIVCLARPSLYQGRMAWGRKFPIHTRLDLNPLSGADARDLVKEILRLVDPLPQALLDLVSSRAEGNPFYAEELVKMLIDDGVIVTDGAVWHAAPEGLLDLKVPDTLTGVIQARLDSLAPAEKQTVQQASVIGRIFWDRALDALPGKGHLALPALQAKEFISPHRDSAFAGVRAYIFKHALIRDVIYETVLLRLRHEYHALIAQWLEQNAGDRLGEFSGLIAEHYTLAEEYDLASVYWQRLGDDALKNGDFVGAEEAFELALKLAPEGGPLRLAELERKLAATLPPQQRQDEAETFYRSALDRLDGPPSAAVYEQWQSARLNILLGLSDALYFQRRSQAMAELDEEIQALLDKVGTAKQQSEHYARLVQMAFLQNRSRLADESFSLVQKALAYAQESCYIPLIARQQLSVGFHFLWRGELEKAAPFMHQALATAKELGDSWLQNQCLVYLTILYRFQGNRSKVAAYLPEMVEISQQVGYSSYIGVCQANAAWLHYHAGEWRQAQEQCEAALASWSKSWYPFEWLAHWLLLAISLKQERLADAAAAAQSMLDPEQQQLADEVEEALGTAVEAWEAKDETAARSYLETAVDLASQIGYL